VEPGKRAYSLDGSANPLGELLRVGDQVDVLVERNQKSTTLIERVSVLAVGADLGADNEDLDEVSSRGGGVTLSVTPTEAESLQAAETGGDLRLVVRNPSDLRVSEQSVSTTEESRSSWKHEESRAQKTREIEHVR
jgi:Flp pilus assembly protein CpaB